MELNGKIEKKESKPGTNKNGNAYNLSLYTINGQVYSTFDSDLAVFNEGDNVSIDYIISGKYNNINTMMLLEKGSEATEAIPETNVDLTPIELTLESGKKYLITVK